MTEDVVIPALPARYEPLEQVGEGAMATVWKALDQQRDGLTVAIKLMRKRTDLEPIQRLAQEAAILAELRHPCIVEIYDTGVAGDDCPYVVMEWVDGITLRERLVAEEALSVPDTIEIVVQICDALTVAHGHEIIHRDLKPENVLLCGPRRQVVKIVDFGMAKVLRPEAPVLTIGEKIFGTPQYMAPERARGRKVGAPYDVYAVGIICYEMLAGRRPFDAKLPMDVLLMQCNDLVPPLPEGLAALEGAVVAALEKEPEDRPTAAAFAAALETAATES